MNSHCALDLVFKEWQMIYCRVMCKMLINLSTALFSEILASLLYTVWNRVSNENPTRCNWCSYEILFVM